MPEISPKPAIQIGGINMDCRDPAEMAEFWGKLLGWEITWRDDDFIVLGNPGGGPNLSFQEYKDYRPPVWPEEPGELVEDDPSRSAGRRPGGRSCPRDRLRGAPRDYQGKDDLRVMLDPAGHPFCLCKD